MAFIGYTFTSSFGAFPGAEFHINKPCTLCQRRFRLYFLVMYLFRIPFYKVLSLAYSGNQHRLSYLTYKRALGRALNYITKSPAILSTLFCIYILRCQLICYTFGKVLPPVLEGRFSSQDQQWKVVVPSLIAL